MLHPHFRAACCRLFRITSALEAELRRVQPRQVAPNRLRIMVPPRYRCFHQAIRCYQVPVSTCSSTPSRRILTVLGLVGDSGVQAMIIKSRPDDNLGCSCGVPEGNTTISCSNPHRHDKPIAATVRKVWAVPRPPSDDQVALKWLSPFFRKTFTDVGRCHE